MTSTNRSTTHFGEVRHPACKADLRGVIDRQWFSFNVVKVDCERCKETYAYQQAVEDYCLGDAADDEKDFKDWGEYKKDRFYRVDTNIPAPIGISPKKWATMDDVERAFYLAQGELF
jgi:hypothetical protein